MPINATTYDGVEAGMNLAAPAFKLADNEARYLQDIWLDYPGITRERGPIQAAEGFSTLPNPGSGLFGTLNPAGSYRIAALDGDNSNGYLRLLDSTFANYDTYTWNGAMPHAPSANPYRLVDAKPALGGGILVGTSNQYFAAAPVQNLAFWKGGDKDDYSTGTITLNRASTAVTGSGTSWTTQASPGMYLFATFNDTTAGTGRYTLTYIGVVKSVESNTALTLSAINPFVQSAASLSGLSYSLTSVRGLVPRVVKGRITTTTASTTVTGANTKFQAQGLDENVVIQSGTTTGASAVVTALASTALLKVGMRITGANIAANSYISSIDSSTQVTMSVNASGAGTQTLNFKHAYNIYRASDLAWVGRLGSTAGASGAGVVNDTSLTLAANAGVAMNNERYVAFKMTGDWSISNQRTDNVGFLNANYANRQWYANNGQRSEYTSRVWYSDTADPEGLDLAPYDGDFIEINSAIGTDAPIKAIVPAYNALVVLKETETFAILGSTPTTFSVKKIEDDGVFCGMTAVPYGGGVIWAGKDGIHYYDGITVRNISADKLGDYYKNAVRNVDPTAYRMWGMMLRDHYLLFIENYEPSVAVVKGVYSVTPSAVTIAINMTSQAVTFITNLAFRGSVETPADTGKKHLYLLNTTSTGYICQGYDLFDVEGTVDEFLASGGISAPQYRYGELDLGTTAVGATAMAANSKIAGKITVETPCAINTISAYMGGIGGGSTTGEVKAVVYDDTAGVPTALLGTSAAVTVAQDDQPGFVLFTFATPIEVAAGDYWIGVHIQNAISNVYNHSDTADILASNSDTYAGGATDPFGTPNLDQGPLVIYATVKSAGPDFFFESKKYTEGDAMRKKLFKQLALNYVVQGGSLKLDTVIGLNAIGATSSSTYPASVYSWDLLAAAVPDWDSLAALYPTWDAVIQAVFRPKRIKFLKRSQMLAFRLWKESPSVTRVQLGPFSIGYKWQRVGRI